MAQPTQERVVCEERQPALFAPEQLPELPALVTAAKAYAHNGRTTCRDEEHAQALLEHYLATGSLRATARRFHVSPHTITAVLVVFEANGKLAALKERVSSKLGVVIELATDCLIENLAAGTVQSNVLPIVLGVAVEKKALIDGEATSRSEALPAKAVDLGDLADYLRSHGVTPTIDVSSTVQPSKP